MFQLDYYECRLKFFGSSEVVKRFFKLIEGVNNLGTRISLDFNAPIFRVQKPSERSKRNHIFHNDLMFRRQICLEFSCYSIPFKSLLFLSERFPKVLFLLEVREFWNDPYNHLYEFKNGSICYEEDYQPWRITEFIHQVQQQLGDLGGNKMVSTNRSQNNFSRIWGSVLMDMGFTLR